MLDYIKVQKEYLIKKFKSIKDDKNHLKNINSLIDNFLIIYQK